MVAKDWFTSSALILLGMMLSLGCTGNVERDGSSHGMKTVSDNVKAVSDSPKAIEEKTVQSSVDLRGPHKPKGVRIRETLSVTMGECVLKSRMMDREITGKILLRGESLEETEIVESGPNGPTFVKIRHLRDTTEITTSLMGQTDTEKEQGTLVDQPIIGKRVDGKWSFSLENKTASTEQSQALRQKAEGYGEDRDFYPEGKTAIGTSWKTPEGFFGRIMGTEVEVLSVSGQSTLTDVTERKGRRQALISVSLKVKGIEKESRLSVAISLEGQYYRDLTDYLDVDGELKGTVQYSGSQSQDGIKVQLEMQGPLLTSYSQSIVKADNAQSK